MIYSENETIYLDWTLDIEKGRLLLLLQGLNVCSSSCFRASIFRKIFLHWSSQATKSTL